MILKSEHLAIAQIFRLWLNTWIVVTRVGCLVVVKIERKGPEPENKSPFVMHSADIGPLNYIVILFDSLTISTIFN